MAKLSQNWLDVLIPFSHEYNKKWSGSEISRISKIPQRSVSRYLTNLVKEGVLRFEERGNNKFYYLDFSNDKINIILNLIESYKTFIFSQNNPLWKEIKELTSFGTIILFGSHVKNYSNESSDIDLVIFSKNTKNLKDTLRMLPKVQAQIITYDNFEKLLFGRDLLSSEILKNHVIFGEPEKIIKLCKRFYGR